MSAFLAQGNQVVWTLRRPVPLDHQACETLLGVFIDADAREAYWELHQAYLAAGGIERAAPFGRAA